MFLLLNSGKLFCLYSSTRW